MILVWKSFEAWLTMDDRSELGPQRVVKVAVAAKQQRRAQQHPIRADPNPTAEMHRRREQDISLMKVWVASLAIPYSYYHQRGSPKSRVAMYLNVYACYLFLDTTRRNAMQFCNSTGAAFGIALLACYSPA
jgi:hypothetical protein